MKIAVIYARYSCDNQTEQSIEGQLRVCQQYAKNNDILIVDTYIDCAMTGTNDNRPDFQRMMKDSAKKEWDYVLVYKLDRFSRNKYESVLHKRTLKENGVKVLSAMENIPDSPEGIILESLLEGMNQYYSAELSQKVKRGMRETRLKGYFQGGTLLYGYKVEGRKIVIDEEEAAIVKYVYQQYSLGYFARHIVAEFRSKGILYRGGKQFTCRMVFGMIRNEKYSGKYYCGDELVENMYPQIIPDDVFQKVRSIAQKRKRGAASVKTTYLLKGKLKCGRCGSHVNGDSGRARLGKTYYYYKCHAQKQHFADCQMRPIPKEILEKFVLEKVITKMSEPKVMDAIVRKLLDLQEQWENNRNEVAILEKQKKQLENTLENLVIAVERGVITETTTNRIRTTEAKIKELEKQIIIENSKTHHKVTEDIIREYYNTILEFEPLILISTLIKVITLYDDKIEITFNSPNKKSPDDDRGSLFYSDTTQFEIITQNRNEIDDMQIDLYV